MDNAQTLVVGGQVPHFRLSAADGETIDYSSIWQAKNLVLVSLPSPAHARRAIQELRTLNSADTTCVVTRERVPGLPSPGVLIADKWGEIMHVATVDDLDGLPDRNELAAWVEHVRQRCPECEGEAR